MMEDLTQACGNTQTAIVNKVCIGTDLPRCPDTSVPTPGKSDLIKFLT